jgi:hypothetical protein
MAKHYCGPATEKPSLISKSPAHGLAALQTPSLRPHFTLLCLLTSAMVALSGPQIGKAVQGLWDEPGRPEILLGQPSLVVQPAPPFSAEKDSPADFARAADCLGQAIYYEAGFEPENGQRAVAQVVLNRVRDPNFPNTVCGVVYQGFGRKTGCQFSFVCDGSIQRRPPDADKWKDVRKLAVDALDGYVVAAVGAATHYHTDYVVPWWKSTVVRVAQIGQHIFYCWPGKAGQVSALTAKYAGDEVSVWDRLHPVRHAKPARRGRSRRA